MRFLKLVFFIFTLGLFVFVTLSVTFAQSQNDLTKQIKEYEEKLSQLQNQSKTLSLQISVMNNQIKLTQLRIESTKQLIIKLGNDVTLLGGKIDTLEGKLKDVSEVLLNRIVVSYQIGTVDPITLLFSSDGFSDYVSRTEYIQVAQEHDRKLLFELEQTKINYNNQKNILKTKQDEQKKLSAQLEGLSRDLDQQKKSKETLLAETQGSEATYQKLLAQAQAQLRALSRFATSRTGGIEIIPHADLSDGWGKYYNQRDANWGNNFIGTSGERIWEVGCLLTSYAMVVTHYGGSITSADVAANAGNFWYSTALFLKPGPSANGHGATSTAFNPPLQDLKDALNSGKAVIAGLSYDGGPIADHWLVLRSVEGDSFRVNDPLYQGAMNVSLNDHYQGLKIVEARIYQ